MWNRIKNVEWSVWFAMLLNLFVLQWFCVRLAAAWPGVRASHGKRVAVSQVRPTFALVGWEVPLTGWPGIRSRYIIRHWVLWLTRPMPDRSRLMVFPRRRSA